MRRANRPSRQRLGPAAVSLPNPSSAPSIERQKKKMAEVNRAGKRLERRAWRPVESDQNATLCRATLASATVPS